MTQVNIIAIFVRKNETTQSIGSTIVKNVIILLIPNVFLKSPYIMNGETTEILSSGALIYPPSTNIPLLLFRRLRTALIIVTSVVDLAMI